MARSITFTIFLSAIFLNNIVSCFKISSEIGVEVIVARNLTKFLKENPNAVELIPLVTRDLDVGYILSYRYGNRVPGMKMKLCQ